MKRFFLTFFAVVAAQLFLGGLVLILITSIGAALMGRARPATGVPPRSWLMQEIPADLPEYLPAVTLPFRHRVLSHTDVLENLEKAAVDARIAGVVLKLEMPQAGFAKLDELRARVRAVRAAGKPVYAYATLLTQKDLYLAAACDSIFVHPAGIVHLAGLNGERFYLRRLLDRLDIRTQVSQIKEYKAMAEMVLREEMSAEARENARWVLEELYDGLLEGIAAGRGREQEEVVAWFESCQFEPGEAVERGIADRALLWEDLEALLDCRDRTVTGPDYADVPRASLKLQGPRIAVVHGAGTITQGSSGWVFPLGATMGDETLVEALQQALDDRTVTGVLLRLDTGGGLSSASERIGRMVEQVAARKPLVVSMVDIAASGGYMAAYRCTTLVAAPRSVVGSIGSIQMRGDFSGLLARLGVTIDRVTVGPHATSLSATASLTAEEFARLEQVHWRSYERWVEDVARWRGMTVTEVDGVARGRVFTGRQALEGGLVDELGGFDEALARLKTLAGVDPDAPVSMVHLPRPKSWLERLTEGDLGGMALALGLGPSERETLGPTLEFWQRCQRPEEALALCWWRF